jgi:hypothetical protein
MSYRFVAHDIPILYNGTLLCPKTCACHQHMSVECQGKAVVVNAVHSACKYALCARRIDGIPEKDCDDSWAELQSSAALLQEAEGCKGVLAAVLSATFVTDRGPDPCAYSLAWLTLGHGLANHPAQSVQRLQWLLAQGACAEQGLVSSSGTLVCRLACVATKHAMAMRVMEGVGFNPIRRFFCSLSAALRYRGVYAAAVWARWHARRGRRHWFSVVLCL